MQCPNCSYKLVLLSNRRKYKCALCSKLYPQKFIESKDFRKWDKEQRDYDIKNLEIKREQELKQIRDIKKALKYLFNGLPKTSKKEYYRQKSKEWRLKNLEHDDEKKREYRERNRVLIRFKAIIKRKQNTEEYRRKEREYRKKHQQIMRLYETIRTYRRKQKVLALGYLENGQYRLSNGDIFHSVPTYLLSELLDLTKAL